MEVSTKGLQLGPCPCTLGQGSVPAPPSNVPHTHHSRTLVPQALVKADQNRASTAGLTKTAMKGCTSRLVPGLAHTGKSRPPPDSMQVHSTTQVACVPHTQTPTSWSTRCSTAVPRPPRPRQVHIPKPRHPWRSVNATRLPAKGQFGAGPTRRARCCRKPGTPQRPGTASHAAARRSRCLEEGIATHGLQGSQAGDANHSLQANGAHTDDTHVHMFLSAHGFC